MKTKRELYEQYEEALFSVIMNEIAEEEGTRLMEENDRLNSDEAFHVPEEVTKRCIRTIEREYNKAKARKSFHKVLRGLNRVAIFILIPLCLFIGAFALSETVRVRTLNFLIEDIGVGTRISFRDDESDSSPSAALDRKLAEVYVPTGYALTDSTIGKLGTNYTFLNEEGYAITVTRILHEGVTGTIIIDTEDAEVSYETFHDTEVMIAKEKGEYRAAWPCSDGANYIAVVADCVSWEEFQRILESIVY